MHPIHFLFIIISLYLAWICHTEHKNGITEAITHNQNLLKRYYIQ